MSRPFSRAVIAGCTIVGAATLLTAARNPALFSANPAPPVDSTIWKSLRWRSIGPDRGGRSIAVSGVKGQPKVAYFGATGGGLWKTTDGGAAWTPVTDGQLGSSSVGAVAVAESDPNIIFIGDGRVVHPRQHHAGRRRLQIE
jgi:hypothetical protein